MKITRAPGDRQGVEGASPLPIAGIGPLTASALVATLGDAKSFKNARQVPAWLGMVPRHGGSGGQVTLGGISKRGDVYLRTMLIHGAPSVIAHIEGKPDHADEWLKQLLARRHKNGVLPFGSTGFCLF